jgi:LPS sulfotransferase NodH
MKTIEGINFLTIGEVSKIVDRSAQTIKNWYKWCESKGVDFAEAGLPAFRRDIDAKGTYYYEESDVQKLVEFRDSISYGQMADFNSARWGQRGKEIEARKTELSSTTTQPTN